MHDAGRGWGGRRIGGPRGGRRRRPRCSRASVRTRRGPSAAGVCRCHQGDDACPWRPWGCTTRDCEGAHKSALTDVSLSPVARVTHGFHPRAAGTHNGGSPTDASPSQPDTKKCIQVGRETYAVTSQPGTSYTFDTRIDTATCGAKVGRETIALPPIGTFQVQRPQPVSHGPCTAYVDIYV